MPVAVFIITRLGIFLAAYYGDILLPSDEPVRYLNIEPKPPILGLFSRWDSEWYLYIAAKGYFFDPAKQSPVVFFPLYPLLMKILYQFLDHNVYLSGILISNGCFLAGLMLLYRLVTDVYSDEGMANRTVFYLSVFPASMFFMFIYTESLFFFLVIGCVYFARKRRWWLCALFGALASATRNLGVLMVFWVGWEWLRSTGWDYHRPFAFPGWQAIRGQLAGLGALFLTPSGLVAYMAYLWARFGDPMLFISGENDWHNPAYNLTHVIVEAYRTYLEHPTDPVFVVHHFSTLLLLALFLALPWITKRLGLGACVFCLGYVLVPSSVTLISLPRYVAVLFPFCIVLAELGKHTWIDKTIRVVFPMLLAVFTTVFANWRFFF